MNAFKKTLAAGATLAVLSAPVFAAAQIYGDNSNTSVDATNTTTNTTNGSTTSTTTGGTTGGSVNITPGVPSTGVGPSQAAANAVLLGISAVTALVGGYFLTSGRKKVV